MGIITDLIGESLFPKSSGAGWSFDKQSGRLTISGDLGDSSLPFPSGLYKNILSVVALEGARVKHGKSLFAYMKNLREADLSKLDVSQCDDLSSMFYQCEALVSVDLTGWNTSNVKSMKNMFGFCTSLLSLDLRTWNTGNVETMEQMFSYCKSIQSIRTGPKWCTRNVTDVSQMFFTCQRLSGLEMSDWPSTSLRKCYDMFHDCCSLKELDLTSMDVSHVSEFRAMFFNCNSLIRLNLAGWNTRNVTDMHFLFGLCNQLKVLNLTGWRIREDADTGDMFPRHFKNLRILADDDSVIRLLPEGIVRETSKAPDPQPVQGHDSTQKSTTAKANQKPASAEDPGTDPGLEKLASTSETAAEQKLPTKPNAAEGSAAAKTEPNAGTNVKSKTKSRNKKPDNTTTPPSGLRTATDAKAMIKTAPEPGASQEEKPAQEPSPGSEEARILREQLARQQEELDALKAQIAALQPAVKPESQLTSHPSAKGKDSKAEPAKEQKAEHVSAAGIQPKYGHLPETAKTEKMKAAVQYKDEYAPSPLSEQGKPSKEIPDRDDDETMMPAPDSGEQRRKKILIADDAAFMRMMAKEIFAKEKEYEIAGEAANGKEAVEQYVKLKPDLVLMDITMPEMDGIEALKRIKATDPDAVVVMMSAMGQSQMVYDAVQSGAKDFIVKPLKADLLLGTIKRILGESGNPAGIQKNANETSQEPACCQIVRNGDMVSAKVVVTYKKGMHARPAGILAAKMYGYKSKVEIIIHGRSYNAKSVLRLITSGIRNRDEITIQCKGPDSEEALIKAIELFENDFGFKSD